RHPWESKPFSWPMSLRPLLYYYADGEDATGCGADECVRAVMMIGTPAMWWLSLPMLAWALWKIVTRRDRRCAWIVGGDGAGLWCDITGTSRLRPLAGPRGVCAR